MFSLSFTSNYMMIFQLWFLLWLSVFYMFLDFQILEDFLVIFLFLHSSFLPLRSETIPCDLNLCYLWNLPYWLVYGKFHMCFYHLHFIKMDILQLLGTTFCFFFFNLHVLSNTKRRYFNNFLCNQEESLFFLFTSVHLYVYLVSVIRVHRNLELLTK